MSSGPLFSNHAGTTAQSFGIGKKGVQIFYGNSVPTANTVANALVGSLYVYNKTGSNTSRVYQVDNAGTWSMLVSSASLQANNGVNVSTANGIVTISKAQYQAAFTNSNVVSNTLTVTHNLNNAFPSAVNVWNNSNVLVSPTSVTSVDANNLSINLSSLILLGMSGTWHVSVSY